MNTEDKVKVASEETLELFPGQRLEAELTRQETTSRLAGKATVIVEPGKVEGTYVIGLHILYPQNPDFIGNEVEVQCSIRDAVSIFEFANASVPVECTASLHEAVENEELTSEEGSLLSTKAKITKLDDEATMSPAVRDALITVLNYVGPDEEQNWRENNQPDDGHIWLDIRTVWRWLGFSDDITQEETEAA